MKLNLINGETVEVFRQNCGYQAGTGCGISVNWNIRPVDLIYSKASGFFVIGPWGSGYKRDNCGNSYYDSSQFEKLIPVSSVVSLEEVDVWESDDLRVYNKTLL
jgi:hypothetical protein